MADTVLRFFTAEQLGETQSLTPDGFLLCQNVPIARTGTLLYSDGEVPVESDGDGIIRILREADEVFAPIAVASFAGKPVTNDHPPEKVAPANWKDYSVGVVLNPRRGDGYKYNDEFLYADLLIQDEEAIKDVREGKREVSAGYDAHYEMVRPGEGRQHFIVGNHVALVEKGRCGPLCSIGDKAMSNRKRPAWFDAAVRAHQTGDESSLVETLEKIKDMLGELWLGEGTGKIKAGDAIANKDEAGGVHVHLHNSKDEDEGEGEKAESGLAARIEALEKAVAILAQRDEPEAKAAPEKKSTDKAKTKDAKEDEDEDDDKKEDKEDDKKDTKDAKEDDDEDDDDKKDKKEDKEDTKDKKAMVGDSTSLRTVWQDVISRAEILAPGIRIPTFDAKQPAKATFDSMCQFRRRVLTEAMKEDDTKAAIAQLAGPKVNLTQMTCDSVAMLFNGASEMVKQSTRDRGTPGEGHNYHKDALSLVDTVKLINAKNREKFGFKS